MSHPYEAILGRLGSRACLWFQPRKRQLGFGAYGFAVEESLNATFAVQVKGQIRALPTHPTLPDFPVLEQKITPCGITFTGADHLLGVRARFRFVSTYWPQNRAISHTPTFFLEVEIERLPVNTTIDGVRSDQLKPVEGELLIGLPGSKARGSAMVRPGGHQYQWDASAWFRQDRIEWSPDFEGAEVAFDLISGDGTIHEDLMIVPFHVAPGQPQRFLLALAAHAPGVVLNAAGKDRKFLYTQDYANLDDVLTAARANAETWLAKTNEFEAMLSGTTLSASQLEILSYGFQSYLANTWWCVGTDGDPWWSVWEGRCYFHSTVDVEYNLAWFYLLLEPELLKLTFEEWSHHVHDRVLSHDIGWFFEANKQIYPHAMPVEENTNFILLLSAYERIVGDPEIAGRHWPMVKQLAEYVLDSDTTGNGFPNEGTANTIDDASPAVQYSREQTYLAIKALAALWIVAPWAKAQGDDALAERCLERVETINATLAEHAWLDDHYAVCLERTTAGLIDVWTKEQVVGELTGWDAYSLYTGNGLLFPLATLNDVKIDYDRIDTDLVEASSRGLCEYGNFHSSADHSNLWVSQNLHRDFLAAYLGHDLSDRARGYMAFEIWENTSGRGGFFMDTYGGNCLNNYPRGATAWGYLLSQGGIAINKLEKRVQLDPPAVPCSVPLLAFADWASGRIPWATFWLEDGEVKGTLSELDLLDGFEIECPFTLE